MTISGRLRAASVAPLLTALLAAAAPAGDPELRSVEPPGAQRGTTFTLTLSGERLTSALAAHFYHPGITVTSIANTDDKTVTLQCAAEATCPPGEYPFRLRTAHGLSELRTVFIGALPTTNEAEPNGDLASAQKVPFNTTVHGIVTNEDADWYAVEVKAGQRITAEIEGMRLGRSLLDPAVAILDARRFELAVSDDSPLLGQDPVATATVQQDGLCYIVVREASYAGSDSSRYRLHIGDFPRPLVAWPPGGQPGQSLELSWPGSTQPPPPLPITLPTTPNRTTPVFALENTATSPSPNYISVLDLPTFDQSNIPDPPPPAPLAIHGVIAAPNELDTTRFAAKAGEPLDVRVLARRLRSPLDPVLIIADDKGAPLATSDDVAGADPELRWSAPADGIYQLQIRDHRARGGPALIYRIEVDRPRPTISASIERIDARRPQLLQSIPIPRGSRFAVMMRAERQDVAGEVRFSLPTLPPGVTVTTPPVPADLPNAPIIFAATPDAPLEGGLYELNASIGDTLTGGFRQLMPLVLGPPNDTVYYQTSVNRIAIAVTEAAPFRVKLIAPASPILRSGSKPLKVIVERNEGFTSDIVIQMLWNPPGVSSGSSITIPAAQTEGTYPLNAAGDAPLKSWPIAVTARAPVAGGDVTISSELIDLTVADAFTGGSIQMAATERGKPATVLCKLEPVRAFEGKAKLTLLGLPPKTSAPIREISPEDREIVFDVTTEDGTPVGQHKGLFCEFETSIAGETVTQRFAYNGVLRIDNPPPNAPPPEPTPPPATTDAAPPPPPPPPKPLSRLEQLRQKSKPPAENPK